MAKKKTSLTIRVTEEGVLDTLKALNRLPKDANNELRDRAQKLAESLVPKIQSAARADVSPQAALMAPLVKARRDRLPVIVAGGTKRVGRRRVPAWAVLFGAEFGANRFPQFRKAHTGRDGSWLFGVVESERTAIFRAWDQAADAVVRKFSDGGV